MLPNLETQPAILRLEIEGNWTLADITQLLENIRQAYINTNALDCMNRLAAYERDISFSNAISEQMYQSLRETAHYYTSDIYVHSLSFASPGWVELIGSLNPLKVLADAITAWRKENTERIRIQFDFAKTVLSSMGALGDQASPEKLQQIMAAALNPTSNALAAVAKDKRVTNAKFSHLNPTSDEPVSTGRDINVKRIELRGENKSKGGKR